MGRDRGVAGANLGTQRSAKRKNDVAVLVSVLKHRVAAISLEVPTRGLDDFVETIDGRGAGNEIKDSRFS